MGVTAVGGKDRNKGPPSEAKTETRGCREMRIVLAAIHS